MNYELYLPFVGNINIWPIAIGVIALLLVWDHIPNLVAWAVKKVIALGSDTITNLFKKSETKPATPEIKATVEKIVEQGIDKSLDALQSLTVWAVKDAGPEVLGKITALYADLQKQLKDGNK